MLRNEWVAIENLLRGVVRPTVSHMPRGTIETDTVGLHGYADGTHVATIMGIRVNRSAFLDDDYRVYYDEYGNDIYITGGA